MATTDDMAPEPPQTPERIDLGGDVTLLVGRERTYVEFAAFKEGGDVAAGKTIKLADDDPKAITTLCKILHMQYELSVLPLSSKDLLDLAIVADKYDCVKPLALSLESIFPKCDTSNRDSTQLANLVCASYLLDHPQLFQHFTQSIVGNHAASFDDIASGSIGQLLPMSAWLKLESKRAKVLANNITSGTANPTAWVKARSSYSELLATFSKTCTGLCLDCVKAGGKNQGKCRIAHT